MEERIQTAQNVKFEQFMEDLKAVIRDGQQLLKVGIGDVKARAVDGVRTTEQTVRDHPYKSLGTVFGLGVLVGILAVSMMGGKED